MKLFSVSAGMVALVLLGVIVITPFPTKAIDRIDHGHGDGRQSMSQHEMGTSQRRLIESTMSHVSLVESYLLDARARRDKAEIQMAENSLRDSENLLISLVAQAAGVPVLTVTTMHSSGVSYYQICNDLGVFDRETSDYAMGARPDQGLMDIRYMAMNDDGGISHHGNTHDYDNRSHHGYSSRYSGNYNHYATGGMGGMH